MDRRPREFPNIDPKKLKYGSLAGSHLGLAVRCAHQRMKTPLGLDLAAVVENDAKLKKVAGEGFEYLVLKEDTPSTRNAIFPRGGTKTKTRTSPSTNSR